MHVGSLRARHQFLAAGQPLQADLEVAPGVGGAAERLRRRQVIQPARVCALLQASHAHTLAQLQRALVALEQARQLDLVGHYNPRLAPLGDQVARQLQRQLEVGFVKVVARAGVVIDGRGQRREIDLHASVACLHAAQHAARHVVHNLLKSLWRVRRRALLHGPLGVLVHGGLFCLCCGDVCPRARAPRAAPRRAARMRVV
mmetsp:Transcript_8500/g.26289  ORF Transcript_8500/g.26289 Transcript_8500/m.26289 type:complete len:201 (-) Transcript_8500:16-618(-)